MHVHAIADGFARRERAKTALVVRPEAPGRRHPGVWGQDDGVLGEVGEQRLDLRYRQSMQIAGLALLRYCGCRLRRWAPGIDAAGWKSAVD